VLSSAKPSGGSGLFTLFRPEARAGGKKSGHLAKDSSVYQISIARSEERGATTYELAIPWSEIGVQPSVGAKFGVSLQINDNDGKGKAAVMEWGRGLSPAWDPAYFGIATLIDRRKNER